MNRADIERVTVTTDDPRAEQIAQLRAIFPEVVTEGKIDVEKLLAALGDDADTRPERYTAG